MGLLEAGIFWEIANCLNYLNAISSFGLMDYGPKTKQDPRSAVKKIMGCKERLWRENGGRQQFATSVA